MKFNKKLYIYGLIALFILSMYHDLIERETNTVPIDEINEKQYTPSTNKEFLKVKVQENDSVLSIVKRINKTLPKLHTEQIVIDFLSANPTLNSQKIKADNYYYFPVYD